MTTYFNPYEVLDVPTDASAKQVKKAWREKVKGCHPDRGGNQEEFEKVQSAYEILIDPRRRERYDRHGDVTPEDTLARLGEFKNLIVDVKHADHILEPIKDLEHAKDDLTRALTEATSRHEQVVKDLAKIKGKIKDGNMDIVLTALTQIEAAIANGVDALRKQLAVCNDLLGQYRLARKVVGRAAVRQQDPWKMSAADLLFGPRR